MRLFDAHAAELTAELNQGLDEALQAYGKTAAAAVAGDSSAAAHAGAS